VYYSVHINSVYYHVLFVGSCGANNFFRSYTPLQSPNYPEAYPDNLDCRWHIKLEPGLQVVVNISAVRLEGNYDTLRLFEGECCNTTHLVAQFTGSSSTNTIILPPIIIYTVL